MKPFRKMLATLVSGLGLAAALASGALAQDFPNRTITMIVPFTPGGITDTSARLFAEGMAEHLGVEVVVENRPGAGGTVGTGFGAQADADGYTVVFGTTGTLALSPYLYSSIPYDPAEDFEAIHTVLAIRNVVVINPDAPFETIEELVAYGRENPGVLNFGSPGVGTSSHLIMELFRSEAGIDGVHVPFQGSAPAINELIAGRIDVLFDFLSSSGSHIEAGTLVAVATTGAERLGPLPDVPTMIEAGVPGATAGAVAMLVVPDGVPQDRKDMLIAAASHAFDTDRVQEYFDRTAVERLRLSGDELDAFIEQELETWGPVVEASGVEQQ